MPFAYCLLPFALSHLFQSPIPPFSRGSLPDYFDNFFASVGFTNGGMRYDLMSRRLSQSLRTSPLGPYMARLPEVVTDWVAAAQLASIWSPTYADARVMEADIRDMLDILKYRGGHRINHKTITYLTDRARLEPRWLASLARLDLPVLLLWGDSDAVSPMDIPRSLAQILPRDRLVVRTLHRAGHFLMLERPRDWARMVTDFVDSASRAG